MSSEEGGALGEHEDGDADGNIMVGNIKSVAPDCRTAWSTLCTEYGSPERAEMLL